MSTVWSNMGIQKNPTSKALDVSGDTNIDSSTTSTSPTSGALTVLGGVGIAGDLYVGGSVNFASSVFNNITVRGTIFNTPASSTGTILSSTIVNEANSRFYIDGTGKLFWGAGGASTSYDVQMGRTATGIMTLTGGMITSGASSFNSTVSVTGNLTVGSGFTCLPIGDLSALSLTLNSGSITSTLPSSTTNAITLKTTGVVGNTYTLDSSGNMVWVAGMTLSTSAVGSVYAGKMVFNYLNATSSFYLSTSLNTYISGSSDNVGYYGNHVFNGITKIVGGLTLSSPMFVLSPTTGFNTFSLSTNGLLQWYNTLGVAGTAQISCDTAGNVLQSSGSFNVLGSLQSNGISCFGQLTVQTGALVLNNGPFSFKTNISTLANTSDKSVTFPNSDGSVLLDTSIQTVSNKLINDIRGATVSLAFPVANSTIDVTNVSVVVFTSSSSTSPVLNTILDTSTQTLGSRQITLINNSGYPVTISGPYAPAGAAGIANPQIAFGTAIVPNSGSAILNYDRSINLWRVISIPPVIVTPLPAPTATFGMFTGLDSTTLPTRGSLFSSGCFGFNNPISNGVTCTNNPFTDAYFTVPSAGNYLIQVCVMSSSNYSSDRIIAKITVNVSAGTLLQWTDRATCEIFKNSTIGVIAAPFPRPLEASVIRRLQAGDQIRLSGYVAESNSGVWTTFASPSTGAPLFSITKLS